ncbi:MAG: PASTA domain-containing protein, partial [Chloroflexi bacterium]
RDPLMQLVGLKSADAVGAPDTGGSPKSAASPTPSPSPSPSPVPIVAVPNVGCMNALAAQQAIEKAGFTFIGRFTPQAGYANGIVIRTQPVAGGSVLKGSDVTAFVSTGPPPGIIRINQCLLVIKQLPPNLISKYQPLPTASP